MTSAARKIEFQPRQGLKRTLRFHFSFGSYSRRVAIFSLVYAVVAVPFLFVEPLEGLKILATAVLLFWASRSIGRMKSAQVEVREDSFSVRHGDVIVTSPFRDVAAVRFSMWRRKTFTIEMSNGRRHRFTTALERSEYLLEALAAARPEFLEDPKFLKFRRKAILNDHFHARYDVSFNNVFGLALNYIVFPLMAMALILIVMSPWNTPPVGAAALVTNQILISNICFGYLIYCLSESYLYVAKSRRLREDPMAVRRDLVAEKRVFRAAERLRFGLFLGLLAIAALRLTISF